MTCCAWPGCDKEGDFPAPRDPRNIGARQFFCAEHIKEFNKNWNGLQGFDAEEIFSMQNGGATWNRPTWKMGVQAEAFQQAFRTADELYRFFRQRQVKEAKDFFEKTMNTESIPADVMEACRIFETEEPFGGKLLKQKYLQLVKENHPDVNADESHATETIKRINVAYKILEDYTRRQA